MVSESPNFIFSYFYSYTCYKLLCCTVSVAKYSLSQTYVECNVFKLNSLMVCSGAYIQGVLGVRCTPTESQCHQYYIFAGFA
jgi:hypothetical protein